MEYTLSRLERQYAFLVYLFNFITNIRNIEQFLTASCICIYPGELFVERFNEGMDRHITFDVIVYYLGHFGFNLDYDEELNSYVIAPMRQMRKYMGHVKTNMDFATFVVRITNLLFNHRCDVLRGSFSDQLYSRKRRRRDEPDVGETNKRQKGLVMSGEEVKTNYPLSESIFTKDNGLYDLGHLLAMNTSSTLGWDEIELERSYETEEVEGPLRYQPRPGLSSSE